MLLWCAHGFYRVRPTQLVVWLGELTISVSRLLAQLVVPHGKSCDAYTEINASIQRSTVTAFRSTRSIKAFVDKLALN